MSTSIGVLPRDTARPFYQQIKDFILDRIDSGAWRPGVKIPSEHTLVDELGVSRMTVNRALRELTQSGHLKRVHGVGTFVAAPPSHGSLIELRNIADEIRALGKTYSAKVKLLERVTVDNDIGRRLQLEAGSAAFHVVVVHLQDDVPMQLEDRYVNPKMAPDFIHTDFSATTPNQYLMTLFQPDEIEHVVKAVMPDAGVCEALAISRAEPCLRLERRTWKKQEVVTSASLIYPSSRYDLVARYASDRADSAIKE